MTFSGSINLHGYQGVPSNKVKVGTIKRAKGLEFKLVMLPWSTAAHSHFDDERTARDLRERYVAATRARDVLWIASQGATHLPGPDTLKQFGVRIHDE